MISWTGSVYWDKWPMFPEVNPQEKQTNESPLKTPSKQPTSPANEEVKNTQESSNPPPNPNSKK